MATVRLDERRVRALKPRKSAYDVRDRRLMGFGVRVMPSGAKRYFVHFQYQGRRTWKIVGQVGSIGTDEARDRAKTVMAAIREGSDEKAAASPGIALGKV
ncbi:MAG: Arm DNA-binding domain-containing protein [Rhodospirillales bacterium]|nr:Arm DNA-binding domain-containing protein [Rhodospirillales bacterium]